MNYKAANRFIFLALSFIWGSSFILMKEGMLSLTAVQVASLRIISAAAVLLPVTFRFFRTIPKNKHFPVFLSGALGNLIPAYLFCIAEEQVDSNLAGTLNSLTPVFAIVFAALFFQTQTSRNKVTGIFISLGGSVLLFFAQPGFREHTNLRGVLFIIAATTMYGLNINLVRKFLRAIPSLQLAAVALAMNALPALIVLFFSGYFSEQIFTRPMLVSTGYTFILGVFGTALASIIFYVLIKKAGMVFASMVTYAIPVVALLWGIIYGEFVGWKQVACLLVILGGVYIANRANKKVA